MGTIRLAPAINPTRYIQNRGTTHRFDQFPAHVLVEQFSPILPDNYRETSYPVAVYRWYAQNPTNHAVTVSILLSWILPDNYRETSYPLPCTAGMPRIPPTMPFTVSVLLSWTNMVGWFRTPSAVISAASP